MVLVMIGSMSVPICSCFHARLANSSETTTFRGYYSFMPSCASFLEPTGCGRKKWTSKFFCCFLSNRLGF